MDENYPEFEEIAHTADVQIIAYGRTLEELFINAGKGMYSVSGAEAGHTLVNTKKASLYGSDQETLLIAYLEELIFLAEQNMIVQNPKLNISLTNLDGDFPLYSLNKMMIEIKAVTYHEMDINQRLGLFSTRITFDI